MIVIRVFIEKICSEQNGKSIGSLLYANSYLYFDDSNSICVTEAVPNLLQWHTNKSHYACTARQIVDLVDPQIDVLGKITTSESKVQGFMPVKSEL